MTSLLCTYDTSVDAVLVVGNALRRHSSYDEVTTIVLPRRQTTEVHYWYTRTHARARMHPAKHGTNSTIRTVRLLASVK